MSEIKLEIIESPTKRAAVGRPLLFVHGAYAGAWCWQANFLPYFAGLGYHGFALSLRGHGLSDGRAQLAATSISDYACDVDVAVRRIEASTGLSPILIGHSMGGFVLQQYARDHRVAGLALLATVPPEGLIGSMLHLVWRHPQLMWELNLLQQGGMPPHMDKLRELLFSPALPDSLLLQYAARFQHESDRALIDMSLLQFDQRPPLGQPPALVLGCEDDKLMPSHLSHSAARALGVRAQMLGGVGHLLMLDAGWQIAADALALWLASLP
ncbi:alpha/beta hydrolase [Chitinimonas arctica]|uniref:alpha/beta hydrolase n=1 Tax=Chitinimonas arctica TaxID=2594795 RepID=UPI0015D10B77|nr:alpha/beta fold hydrolase [Chitinimonas arctica]